MKIINKIILLLSISVILQALSEKLELIVNITNISNDEGQVIVKLYNSEDTFLKTPFEIKTAKIVNGKATVVFQNITDGIYSFSVIHDENGNNKIDFNFLGIPSEDVAASNNAAGFLGPPNYEDAKFEVKSESVIQNIIM